MFEMCCLKVSVGSRVTPRLRTRDNKGILEPVMQMELGSEVFEFGWNGKRNLFYLHLAGVWFWSSRILDLKCNFEQLLSFVGDLTSDLTSVTVYHLRTFTQQRVMINDS